MNTKWILVVFFVLRIMQAHSYCYTPWGSKGRCVNIKRCNPLLTLLKRRPLLPPVLNVLQQAQCGFEGLDPKVCCEMRDQNSGFTVATDIVPIEIETETTTTMRTITTKPVAPIPVYNHPNRRLVNDDLCGPIPEGRIFGGNITSIYEFPWMALLAYDVGGQGTEFRCGGSLISKRYVLTAAHCATDLPTNFKLVSVRLGDHDLSEERDCDQYEDGVGYNCAEKYQDFGIERVDIHPDFTRIKLHNDIALVKLDADADFNPVSVRPICLPLGNAAFIKAKKVVVTGWGSTEVGIRSQKLLKVTLPIVDTETCTSAYRHQVAKIWYKQICAGGMQSMDSCSGDSGGPLQSVEIYNGTPRTVQYGIVSFGAQSCGLKGFPGVYTNVAYYVKWILDTMTD